MSKIAPLVINGTIWGNTEDYIQAMSDNKLGLLSCAPIGPMTKFRAECVDLLQLIRWKGELMVPPASGDLYEFEIGT